MSACTLVACPSPMQPAERVFCHVPAGQTLAEMVGPDASHSLSIEVGGHTVPRELWAHTRPKPGQTIHATSYPQGGNGGKWLRTIAIAVISYYTFGAGGAGAAGGGWLGAGTSAFTYYAVGAIALMAVTPMIGNAREVAA